VKPGWESSGLPGDETACGRKGMNWFNNLRVRTKLLSGFIIVAILMCIVGVMGIRGIMNIDAADTAMYEINTKPLGDIGNVAVAFQRVRVNLRDIIINNDAAEMRKNSDTIRGLNKKIEQDMSEFEKVIKSKEVRDEFVKLKTAYDQFLPLQNRIMDHGERMQNEEALKLLRGDAFKLAKDIENAIDSLFTMKVDQAKTVSDENTALAGSVTWINITIIIIGFIVAMFLGILITRVITKQLGGEPTDVLEVASRIADGDLTVDVKVAAGDASSAMAAMKKMTEGLEKLVSEIIVGSMNLTQAVEQISSGNQNMSQRTSEQASALEEVASSVEEASATINQNAESAGKAREMLDRAADQSNKGYGVAAEAVRSIETINQASKKIAEIISVINEIAFQTNLLALNAAVEAARAGDQGRGFAVVAGEVRNLAQRSGASAKDIETLIKDVVSKIENGTDLVNRTGEALAEIAETGKLSSQIVTEIAAASQEQRQGMSQINVAITDLDNMTQQNAALVEETASASEEMTNQAQELLSMVQRFKIRESMQSNAFKKKHKEIHLQAASERKQEGRDDGNGREKRLAYAPAGGTGKKAGTESLKKVLTDEGFEEF